MIFIYLNIIYKYSLGFYEISDEKFEGGII